MKYLETVLHVHQSLLYEDFHHHHLPHTWAPHTEQIHLWCLCLMVGVLVVVSHDTIEWFTLNFEVVYLVITFKYFNEVSSSSSVLSYSPFSFRPPVFLPLFVSLFHSSPFHSFVDSRYVFKVRHGKSWISYAFSFSYCDEGLPCRCNLYSLFCLYHYLLSVEVYSLYLKLSTDTDFAASISLYTLSNQGGFLAMIVSHWFGASKL